MVCGIAEVVDPHINIVAKISKDVLAQCRGRRGS